MTIAEAKQEIPNIDVFNRMVCNQCTANEWYCPTECNTLEKARHIDFERIVERYAHYDGDLQRVCRYIRQTKSRIRRCTLL